MEWMGSGRGLNMSLQQPASVFCMSQGKEASFRGYISGGGKLYNACDMLYPVAWSTNSILKFGIDNYQAVSCEAAKSKCFCITSVCFFWNRSYTNSLARLALMPDGFTGKSGETFNHQESLQAFLFGREYAWNRIMIVISRRPTCLSLPFLFVSFIMISFNARYLV